MYELHPNFRYIVYADYGDQGDYGMIDTMKFGYRADRNAKMFCGGVAVFPRSHWIIQDWIASPSGQSPFPQPFDVPAAVPTEVSPHTFCRTYCGLSSEIGMRSGMPKYRSLVTFVITAEYITPHYLFMALHMYHVYFVLDVFRG